MTIDWQPGVPRWRQVYEVIKARIKVGQLAPGDRIPSVLALNAEFGIANVTAQKVMRQLRLDGLIYTEPGMGSFVADPETGGPPKRDPQDK